MKAALAVATHSVTFKLSLSFLEPCVDRGVWLQNNAPAMVVFRRRANYAPALVAVRELWGVWYKTEARNVPTRVVFCP